MRKKKLTPQEKIASCKALQGKSVLDVCMMSGFLTNLEAYVMAQREDRKVVIAHAAKFGNGKMHAPAHSIDKTLNWSMDDWREHFLKVVNKESLLPKAVREYVRQLGLQAYNVTVANIVLIEFPELREYFFGKSKVV